MAEKIDKDIQDEIRDPKIRKAVQAARNDRLKAMAAKAREEKGFAKGGMISRLWKKGKNR